VTDFFKALQTQRWDDHRYYHQSRINQSLHFISALSFLAAYVLVWIGPGQRCAAGLGGFDDHAAGRPLLLRAAGLRHVEPGDQRTQGSHQGRLQPAPQGGAD
jgi:hypothetical protein